LVTLDKSFLTKRISKLSGYKMEEVEEGLRHGFKRKAVASVRGI